MRRTIPWALIAPLAILAADIFWALWPVMAVMVERWSNDPRYAHGYLVPLFSLALLWMRRPQNAGTVMKPTNWGLLVIALGGAVQLVGGFFRSSSIEGFAVLPYLAGVALLLGGRPALQWAWPSIAFLIFMIPLPWRIEKALGPPLQYLATLASTFTLQTLGFMAFSEGNVIQLDEHSIGVVEACSGLSMLITFIALSTGMAILVKRPLLDKIVLVLSAIPVALVANITRITLTGILHVTAPGNVADRFYHDFAGWVMIPLALLLYWLEIWVFSRIFVEMEEPSVLVGLEGGRHPVAVGASQAMAGLPRAVRGRG
jgi:exosortase